jgi:hypothetical protein
VDRDKGDSSFAIGSDDAAKYIQATYGLLEMVRAYSYKLVKGQSHGFIIRQYLEYQFI